MSSTMIKHLIILLPALIHAIDIRQESLTDIQAVSGSRAEIFCEVTDIRDPLEECTWYAPNGDKFKGRQISRRRQSDSDDNVKVTIDDRRDECILTIESLRQEHEGTWECVAYEGRDEASKFAVIRVTDKTAPLQLLLDPDETQLEVQRGSDVQMICPTNHFGNAASERPVCKFYDPSGKSFLIIGKYGEILDYEDEGIVHAGDFNNGECGIIVRDIDYEKSGTWKCEVLRKQRPGSSVIGSEITATTFKVDVFRTSRLNDDDVEFQGYREDDDDVEILMEVEVDESKEEFTDFFWLIRKSIRLYEGERKCLDSGRRKNCYEARRRRRLETNNNLVTYELSLEIETLDRDDIDSKLYLVKDYREFRSKIDKFQVLVVPKDTRRGKSLENTEDFTSSSQNQMQRQRLNGGQGCQIKDEFVDKGESVNYPEFCIKLLCKDHGNVDVRSMSESQCRRRRKYRKDIE